MKSKDAKGRGRNIEVTEPARTYRIPARIADDIYMSNLLGSLPRMIEILDQWHSRQMSDKDFFDEMTILLDVQSQSHEALYSEPLKAAIDRGAGGDVEWTEAAPRHGGEEWTRAERLGGKVIGNLREQK